MGGLRDNVRGVALTWQRRQNWTTSAQPHRDGAGMSSVQHSLI